MVTRSGVKFEGQGRGSRCGGQVQGVKVKGTGQGLGGWGQMVGGV